MRMRRAGWWVAASIALGAMAAPGLAQGVDAMIKQRLQQGCEDQASEAEQLADRLRAAKQSGDRSRMNSAIDDALTELQQMRQRATKCVDTVQDYL